jgi:mono/diheme cytochrome c family protein
MLKKTLKVTGIVIGIIVLAAAAFYLKVYISTEKRIHKQYAVDVQKLELATDSATLAYGARLITAKGCNECHGADLGGQVFIDDPALGFLVASNLTKGNGGLPEDHNIDDWILALKHGLNPDGKPLLFMPSHEYSFLSEGDMKAIIAYCTTLEPIDRELPASSVGPLGRILTDLGKLPLIPAEMIDHSRTLATDIRAEVSAQYGKYLAIACTGCHRDNMKGGEPVAPGFPVVADISSTGNPGKWTSEEFMQTLRTGHTPEGKTLDPKNMPWPMTKAYTDVELQALHLYLKSI